MVFACGISLLTILGLYLVLQSSLLWLWRWTESIIFTILFVHNPGRVLMGRGSRQIDKRSKKKELLFFLLISISVIKIKNNLGLNFLEKWCFLLITKCRIFTLIFVLVWVKNCNLFIFSLMQFISYEEAYIQIKTICVYLLLIQ